MEEHSFLGNLLRQLRWQAVITYRNYNTGDNNKLKQFHKGEALFTILHICRNIVKQKSYRLIENSVLIMLKYTELFWNKFFMNSLRIGSLYTDEGKRNTFLLNFLKIVVLKSRRNVGEKFKTIHSLVKVSCLY